MDRPAGACHFLVFPLLMLLNRPPYDMSHTKSTRSAAQKVDYVSYTAHLQL